MKLKPETSVRDAEDLQTQDPEVHVEARGCRWSRSGWRSRTSRRRAPPPTNQLDVDEDAAEEVNPVAEGVEPGKATSRAPIISGRR